MRLSWLFISVFLFCLGVSEAQQQDVKDRIREDILKNNLLALPAVAGSAPSGIIRTEKWVSHTGAPVRSFTLQETLEFKVEAYLCDQEFHYWLRMQGTVLAVDYWYGPYLYPSRGSVDRNYLQQNAAQRGGELPRLKPDGILCKLVCQCRQHNTLLEKFPIPSSCFEELPEGYTVTAFYCREGNHYWVCLKKFGMEEWHGPFPVPQEESERLVVGVTLDKSWYHPGEPIHLEVWVQNQSNRGIWLRVYAATPADYEIDNQYRWSLGRLSSKIFERKFIPRESKTVLMDYDHQAYDYYLAPGAHSIVPIVYTSNYGELIGKPVTFTVVGTSSESGSNSMQRALQYMESGHYDEARQCLKEILAKDPENMVAYYNLACVESLCFNVAEALYYLEKSFQMGFDKFDHLAMDPDLDNLRSHPKFQYLIEHYRIENSRDK